MGFVFVLTGCNLRINRNIAYGSLIIPYCGVVCFFGLLLLLSLLNGLSLWVVKLYLSAFAVVLNYIWVAFFVVAFVMASARLLLTGDAGLFGVVMDSMFGSAKTAFEISLGLTGVLSLWMGVMKIGERGGVVEVLARWLSPLFCKLFPQIPAGHPVIGNIFMNISANLLGLDNAATPLGLKAMEGLQGLNKDKQTASDSMIMFLVLNTSGLTLIPVSIMVYRASMGAAVPTDVFVPILLATFVSTLVGIVATAVCQGISLWNRTVVLFLGGACVVVAAVVWFFSGVGRDVAEQWSTAVANVLLFGIIVAFISAGVWKRVNVYEAFIEGAKDGFSTAVRIIPYLVAIMVAIGAFRASGAMDILLDGVRVLVDLCGGRGDFVEALPTALMKPLSGSGARGMMVDAMSTYGADSFVGRLSCVFQGSTDTTFYILAVYFGSVGVRRTRHAVPCGLLADFAGILAGIGVAYLFFDV